MILVENPQLTHADYQKIATLFELVEWGKRDPLEIQSAFEKSSFTCIAYSNQEMIGFGRTFDDGRYYATLCDVVIAPSHQGQGIGKFIVANLEKRLKGFEFITLTAAPGKGAFYEKIGWKKQTSAYISPTSDKQAKEHS